MFSLVLTLRHMSLSADDIPTCSHCWLTHNLIFGSTETNDCCSGYKIQSLPPRKRVTLVSGYTIHYLEGHKFLTRNCGIALCLKMSNQHPSQNYCTTTCLLVLLVLLTIRVVAVDIPLLAFVQPITVIDNSNLSISTVGSRFHDGIPDTAFIKPSSCTHMKTFGKQRNILFRPLIAIIIIIIYNNSKKKYICIIETTYAL